MIKLRIAKHNSKQFNCPILTFYAPTTKSRQAKITYANWVVITQAKSLKDLVQTRAKTDPAFRYGLLTESIESMLPGDINTWKPLLRDYVNATVEFEGLAKLTGKSSKSLMRMIRHSGNPTAENLFSIISLLQ